MVSSLPDVDAGMAGIVRRAADAARDEGRTVIPEAEARAIAVGLGIGVPRRAAVGVGAVRETGFGGDRVVVKAVMPEVLHKTDVGGVAVVRNDARAIAAVVAAISDASEGDIDGFVVEEYVPHPTDPGGEALLGLRWTDAFGPVVTLGPGGIAAELLTRSDPLVVSRRSGGDRLEHVDRLPPGARLLAEGVRGRPPAASPSLLRELVGRMLALGEEAMPHDLSSFEINPLVFAGGLPMALDVAARAGPATDAEWAAPRPADRIDALLHPGTIAVMGVSERMNPGRVILRNILGAGFPPERITVIKPDAAEIDGCRAVPDLASLPEPVDLLLLAIAAESVPSVVDDAISARAATAIVLISGGLGERAGTEDLAQRVRRAVAVSRTGDWGGPVINGGNSMGLRSGPGGFDATFIPPERMTPGPAAEAPLAVVAQSGAFTLSRLDRLPWLRPRYLVSVGNQIDLTVGDYLAHFAVDPTVEIVACYVEGFALLDGERWLEAAAAIRQRGGAVLLMRGGRTAAGARSAASHTAAVASDDTVARSLAASAGVVEAETLDEFEDLLRLAVLLRGKQIGGLAVGAVSNAGFECVAMADAVGPLHMARFAPATVARLQRLLDAAGLDAIVGPQNPLDLTPVAGDGVFAAAVEAVLDDEGVDLGIIGCVPYTPALRTLPARIAEPGSLPKLLAALAGHPTPWVAVVDGGARYDPMVAFLEESGVPVLRTADRALRLLGRYATRRSR